MNGDYSIYAANYNQMIQKFKTVMPVVGIVVLGLSLTVFASDKFIAYRKKSHINYLH